MSTQKQLFNKVPEEDMVASDGNKLAPKEDKAESDQIHFSGNGENKGNMVIKLSDVRKEVQCPICLGIIRKTKTVKECLHRFCRECIEKSMRLGNNECPVCRTHCGSRRSLRDDPNYDSLIALLYPDVDKYEEEFSPLAWGENGHHSQTGITGENARNNRLSRLVDHLRNSEIMDDELDVYLMIVSLDEQSIPSLELPYLCCKPTLSVKLLCQYVAINTGVQANEVKLFLVKNPQSNIINGERPVDPDKDTLLVLAEQETLAELLKTTDDLCCGHLVMAYLKV